MNTIIHKLRSHSEVITRIGHINSTFHSILLGHRCLYGITSIYLQNHFIMDQLYEYYYDTTNFPQTNSISTRG